MKIRLSLLCIAVALCAFNVADAQQTYSLGDGAVAQPEFRQLHGNLLHQPGFPGRVWLETNFADEALGFQGSYLTVGGKTRLHEDRLDGRWLVEGQVHFSLDDDDGEFFSNIGIERVFSVPAAGANVSVSAWYDYNSARNTGFSHRYNQVAVNASIKTQKHDLIGNGYFPTGTQDYTYGDVTGANCFVGNDIVIVPGIDSALRGFDVALRTRPKQLAFVNGTFDIGGYQYDSDVIDAFGGAKVRFGFQFLKGMIVNVEVNNDNRFDTTGVLGVGWLFGANASGHGSEYSPLGRDLDQTVRNDHIVIFNQDIVLALDPYTGAPYNVVHVDNTADDSVEDGTVERPFDDLLAAETSSAPGDVILVSGGNGTDFNMDAGITLQDDQRLWGNGQSLLIPVQDGVLFSLCTDPDGVTPTISNDGGLAVVTLADNNEVAGINIDATGADFGISGTGVDSGIIRDITVSDATLDGVNLTGITGDWTFRDNTFNLNQRHGLFILDALDPTSEFVFDRNTASSNWADGIRLENYDATTISFLDNITSTNEGDGLHLENFINSTGTDLRIIGHIADRNAGNGILADTGSGDLFILDSSITNITNQSEAGVRIRNWATVDPETILIGTTDGGVSNISGNGALANVEILLDDPGIHSRVLITDQTLDGGVRGIAARVEGVSAAGVQSSLDIDIIDNLSISDNINDGIDLIARDGGIIRANIANTDPDSPLQIQRNAFGGGAGIHLLAEGSDVPFVAGEPQTTIIATIDNVEIANRFNIIFPEGGPEEPGEMTTRTIYSTDGIGIDGTGNSVVDVTVTNATIGNPEPAGGNDPEDRNTRNGVRIALDNNGSKLINKIFIENMTAFSNFGVLLGTGTETYTDFVLLKSTLRPDGEQSTGGRADNTPFLDSQGQIGVQVVANGQGEPVPGAPPTSNVLNPIYPNLQFLDPFYSTEQIISDGELDNLTSVSLIENSIQDFTLEGVDINTTGDAQMLLNLEDNDIVNNGAGYNNDTNNDNVFNNSPEDGRPRDIDAPASPDQLFFYDGVDINAFDESQISARIFSNVFTDNFERGLSLNTFNGATINASVNNNVFFGNDRGEDIDATRPPFFAGEDVGGPENFFTSGFADFEAVNNEEYYFRNYESRVLIDPEDGALIDLAGDPIPDGDPGIFYPGNTGVDIEGNMVASGVANLNLSMSSNSLQLGPDLLDFSVPPGDFELGLDGLTNGFGQPGGGITPVPFTDPILDVIAQEDFFELEGFDLGGF